MPDVAVPPVRAYATVTCLPLAALKVTVKVRVPPVTPVPSMTLGLSIDTVGASSSSVTVPVPVAAEDRVALVGVLNVTSTVSFASWSASPVTVTSMVCVVVPTAKVSVPAVSAV